MLTKKLRRRNVLIAGVSMAALTMTTTMTSAKAEVISGRLPWTRDDNQVPAQINSGPWKFFSADEAAAIEALADRLIPEDALSIGGKNAGVAVYIDDQLAGRFGRADGLYMQAPFAEGLPGQGPQSPLTPAERYRKTLAAIDDYCKNAYLGKGFAALPAGEQDKIITAMASGALMLHGVSSKGFFQVLWQNTKEGFFADPVYGGNRGMAGWKMIGFPGTRYNYLDWIDHHNEAYPHPPVSMREHPNWAAETTGA